MVVPLLVVACALAPACSGDDGDGRDPRPDAGADQDAARLRALGEPAVVVTGADHAELALATSVALFESAPVAALAPSGDGEAMADARRRARAEGIPLLLAPGRPAPDARGRDRGDRSPGGNGAGRRSSAGSEGDSPGDRHPGGDAARRTAMRSPARSAVDARAIAAELDRLDTATVVTFGFPEEPAGLPAGVTAVDAASADDVLARHTPAEAPDGVVALVDREDPLVNAALTTVEAAGVPVVPVTDGDPRRDGRSRDRLAELQPRQVVAVAGPGRFDAPETLAGLVATAVAGTELPGGGQVMFPGRRLVALYGHPGTSALGVLGEQPVGAAVERAASTAAPYDDLGDAPVIPTFEVIATIASASAGSDGDYSSESAVEDLVPWVDAAAEAGMYVVLDLQPGRTDFLTQAKRYEELLRRPHVGLALDPEWRLAPGQRHLQQIGSVSADEVNATAEWLAGLVRDNELPQKLLVVHQFRLDMVRQRERIATPPELAVLFQMDGDGTPGQKMETWRTITADPLPGSWYGWKNFYDEDEPMFSPAETAAVRPVPHYISYQ